MKRHWALAVPCAVLLAASAAAQGENPSGIDDLHQALHLSASQQAGWSAYRAQAAAPNAAQDRRRAASRMFASLTAPQRMDLIEAELRQEMLDLHRQSDALKAFYASLSPDQQAIFDSRTLPPADTR